jgi:DNA-binding MarR family transcriptional regulator
MESSYKDPEPVSNFDHLVPLLEQIELDPDITQATLANRLEVSVGMVNLYLKRLVAKGYVKVKRAQRRKLRYIITPEGIALRARLTVNYIESSMKLYRRTRQKVREHLGQVHQAGFDVVILSGGEGDIADICRLTSLEQGIRVIEMNKEAPDAPGQFATGQSTNIPAPAVDLPVLEVRGTKVILKMPVESRFAANPTEGNLLK